MWEVLEKRARRLTGSKGEPGPANCRSCAFGDDFGSFVLFCLFCFSSFALRKLNPSHPNSSFLSVRAQSGAAIGAGRDVCGDTKPPPHSRQSRGDTKPPLHSMQSRGLGTHTLVPVSTACSGNALCCTNQNIYSSPLSQCSPYL